MDDYNIFDHWDGDKETPKSKFEGLSNDEVIEILKQELLEKEEEEKRESQADSLLSAEPDTRLHLTTLRS